ncbi:reprolysin-like metallopeptidase [Streptomyces sp. NPDC087440]|uniref:InlB B-repeat-containing protein n=1 Tax=Streptomyces sp. NPDC087440 TaxID=3365790 RepID=UPI0038252734
MSEVRRIWWAGCAAAAALAMIVPAAARAHAEAADAGPDPDRPWVLRSGPLDVRKEDLSGLCAPGARTDLTLPLLPGVTAELTTESVGRGYAGTVVWAGHLRDDPEHQPVSLAFDGLCGDAATPLTVAGDVPIRNLSYTIAADATGRTRVEEVDPARMPVPARDDASSVPTAGKPQRPYAARPHAAKPQQPYAERPHAPKPQHPGKPRAHNGIAPSVIDLAVGYLPAAGQEAGGEAGVRTRAEASVSRMNQALADSGADGLSVRIVKVFPIDTTGYAGGQDTTAVVNWLGGWATGSPEPKVDAVREESRADLVLALVPRNGSTWLGHALKPTLPSPETSRSYISAARIDAVPGPLYVVAHELGHNLGLDHDDATLRQQGQDFENPFLPYNRGYVPADRSFHTIMAYRSACGGCTTVPQYSNPLHSHNGQPLGDARHDAVRVLRQTGPVVAAYRENTPPPPAATYTLTTTGGVQAPRGPYPEGTRVTVPANPNPGYRMTSWTLDGRPAGTADPITVTMDRDHTLVAHYACVHPTSPGAIGRLWQQLDGPRQPLGCPLGPVARTPAAKPGWFQHFQNDRSLYWSARTGAHQVRGAIRNRWAAQGWEQGGLGFPTGTEYRPERHLLRQNFQGGHVTYNYNTRTTSLQYVR